MEAVVAAEIISVAAEAVGTPMDKCSRTTHRWEEVVEAATEKTREEEGEDLVAADQPISLACMGPAYNPLTQINYNF